MKVWPFNRKQNTDDLPGEVKEFYESGKRERSGMAWLLALATLVVTVILAIALFYGGRWIYQKIAGDDDSSSQETLQTEESNSSDSGLTPASSGETSGDQQGNSSTSTDQSSAADSDSSSSSESSESTTAPSTGGIEVPDTGPGPNGLQ